MINDRFIKIDSPEGFSYLDSLRRGGQITALLGSGISIWEPSALPNGKKITEGLADIIAASTISSKSTILDLIKRSAFEHIMERYPRPQLLADIIAKTFYPTIPNPAHIAFARLIEAGVIKHLITTNYDVGLESACSTICKTRVPNVIASEGDLPLSTLPDTSPVIFKIHGCASPGREHSMVVTLSDEGEMPAWKRQLLKSLVDGRALLICGYSGLDFEICPELIRLNPSSVAWNSFEDPRVKEDALSPNARRVLSAGRGTVLIGDMRSLVAALGQQPCEAKPSKISPSFVNELVDQLDEWELDRWRAWVLNGLSCALDASRVARRMYDASGSSIYRKLHSSLALGEALFHGGLYFQSRAAYKEAAHLAQAYIKLLYGQSDGSAAVEVGIPAEDEEDGHNPDKVSDCFDSLLRAEVGVVECDRVSGHWIRARRKIKALSNSLPQLAPSHLREKAQSAIALKRILLQRYPYYLESKLHLNFLLSRIRSRVRKDLALVARYSSARGSWFDLQHCEMLANRFDLRFSDIHTSTLAPLESYEGYKHLGYILAEMMAYRAALTTPGSGVAMNYDYLRIAQEIGINPEIWKLARAMEKRFGIGSLTPTIRQEAKRAWARCEYTLPMRLLLWLRGDDA